MGIISNIEWCGPTYNPWQGCTKCSDLCDNCYMYTDKKRWGQNPKIVVRSSDNTFYAPLKWKEPSLVFACSWSDWFHKDADPWRPEAWEIIRATPHLTYQILTKRSSRKEMLDPNFNWPDNVWMGVSVGTENCLPKIKHLQQCGAKTKFLSIEPLLESLPNLILEGNDWVVVGGESGSKARPMKKKWVLEIQEKCIEASIPFFFKQWGEYDEFGKRVGKKKAGRVLEGKTWNEMPPVLASHLNHY